MQHGDHRSTNLTPRCTKTFTVPKYENIKLEFRFDAFNVFNHTNWTLFNTQ